MSRVQRFPLSDLGEGLTDGEIVRWLVAVGDSVTLNQPMVEVETATAVVEIPATWAGTVTEILVPEGSAIEVGTEIIAIDTAAGPSEDALASVGVAPDEGSVEPGLVGGPVSRRPSAAAARRRARATPPARPRGHVPLAAPAVRRLAGELGVDLSTLSGSGSDGSITRDDVHAAWPGQTRERRVPVHGARRLTAERMVASAFSAPHVTEFLTVDVTLTHEVLTRLRTLPGWSTRRATPLLLVARACLLAVERNPLLNATWAGEEVVVHQYVNLGIATSTERGLVVPNVKDAGALSLARLADAIAELVTAARAGRTTPADLTGGTFTITNLGVFGVDTGTPILPPGEAAILAFGAVRESPWVHDGRIEIRRVTTLGLSFDHRIVDGELGSAFLRDVGAFLEDPLATLFAWTEGACAMQ